MYYDIGGRRSHHARCGGRQRCGVSRICRRRPHNRRGGLNLSAAGLPWLSVSSARGGLKHPHQNSWNSCVQRFLGKESCGSVALLIVQRPLPDRSSGERLSVTMRTLLSAIDVSCCFATVSSCVYRVGMCLGACEVCPYVRSPLSPGSRKETVNRAVFMVQNHGRCHSPVPSTPAGP